MVRWHRKYFQLKQSEKQQEGFFPTRSLKQVRRRSGESRPPYTGTKGASLSLKTTQARGIWMNRTFTFLPSYYPQLILLYPILVFPQLSILQTQNKTQVQFISLGLHFLKKAPMFCKICTQ